MDSFLSSGYFLMTFHCYSVFVIFQLLPKLRYLKKFVLRSMRISKLFNYILLLFITRHTPVGGVSARWKPYHLLVVHQISHNHQTTSFFFRVLFFHINLFSRIITNFTYDFLSDGNARSEIITRWFIFFNYVKNLLFDVCPVAALFIVLNLFYSHYIFILCNHHTFHTLQNMSHSPYYAVVSAPYNRIG